MPAGNISSNWDNKAFNAEDSLSDKARLPYRPLSVWLRSILKILIFNWWKLLYNFVLISAIQQHECHNFIYIYTHTSLSSLPSLPPFHPSRSSQVPGWASYVTYQRPTSYLFYTRHSMYVNSTSQFIPPSPFPLLCPQVCSLPFSSVLVF